jgi:hypothetical protein
MKSTSVMKGWRGGLDLPKNFWGTISAWPQSHREFIKPIRKVCIFECRRGATGVVAGCDGCKAQ